jgi:hypothetical protein
MGYTRDVEVADANESTPLMRPALRERAPTITIDSSEVSLPQNVTLLCEEPSAPSTPSSRAQHHRSLSLEDKRLLSVESRPTSSHNTPQVETALHQILTTSLLFQTLAQEGAHSTGSLFHPMAERLSFRRLLCQPMTAVKGS